MRIQLWVSKLLVTGVANSGNRAFQSLELLLESSIDYEVRTTADPQLLSEKDIMELAKELSHLGVKHYVLQQCRPMDLNIAAQVSTIDLKPDSEIATQLKGLFERFSIRT